MMRRRDLLLGAGVLGAGALGATALGARALDRAGRSPAPGGPAGADDAKAGASEDGAERPGDWRPTPRPLAAGFHRGMNFAHLHQRGYGYGSARARAQLERLATLGVAHIAINPFAYMPSLSSPELRWGGDPSMTDADLVQQCVDARDRGIAVMMKPHLWSREFGDGKGNGDIALGPADWGSWFAAYTAYAVHHATLAQAGGCATLCVGLEFSSATRLNPGAWAKVADACRKVYSGRLVYAANWYEEWSIFADWAAFDAVGVDAYFPLVGETVDELAAGWKVHLDALEALGRPVIFCEAGYRAVRGSTGKPWDVGLAGPRDVDQQARAYEALLRATTARSWFEGVYWWKWFTDLVDDVPDNLWEEDDGYLPAGKPAEDVLRAWFRAPAPPVDPVRAKGAP